MKSLALAQDLIVLISLSASSSTFAPESSSRVVEFALAEVSTCPLNLLIEKFSPFSDGAGVQVLDHSELGSAFAG